MTFAKKFIGNKIFYKTILKIMIPIMIQTGITNFVSLLDNIMIGRVGTAQMSGAAIANQLIFVFYLCIMGAMSGVGIYTAQYYGKGDEEGIRHTFRFKFLMAFVISALVIAALILFQDQLIGLYLTGEGTAEEIAATMMYSKQYLQIMLIGLVPYALSQVYADTLRSCGQTVAPMIGGLIAVCVNLALNYLLIYGKLGLPELGVQGAAIATAVSRFVELAFIVSWTAKNRDGKAKFLKGVYKTLKVPLALCKGFLAKAMPLIINETLWSSGMAILNQCYSVRGIHIVAATNISGVIFNLFNVVVLAMGNAIGIIVGHSLGAGKMKEAKDQDNKMLAFSIVVSLVLGAIIVLTADLFPALYNTTPEVRQVAASFIRVAGIFLPVSSMTCSIYFTLRAGGRTVITFLFDSVFIWVMSLPCAFLLSRFTDIPAITIYTCVCALDFIKVIVGLILLLKGVWIKRIVDG